MKKTGMKLLAGVLFGALLAGCSAGQPEAGESNAPSASPVAEQPESSGAADAGRSESDAPDETGEEYYTFALSENVERRPVSYENRYGITLAGELYTPRDMDESELHPAVVIGAPYGGVKEQGPGVWANELAQRGFVCLTFDPSYNGESGGEPRHVSSPEIFTEDVSAGVDYLCLLYTSCRIVHPDFCKILTETLQYFSERGVKFYKKLQHEGYLRHLLVRRAVKTGEILVALVTSTQTDGLDEDRLLEAWRERLLALPLDGVFAGILHIKNDSLADVVQSDETTVLWGQDYFYEELLGVKFKISPFSFFQTNSLGAEVLYETARGYVGETKDKVVFDLYSGTGTIAQILAPVASKVVGVEIVEEAVEAARENASLNGLSNCEFIAGDVLKVVGDLTDKPDLIILDPPRDGIHPKALERIIGFGVERMVYISCKPTSLVRDLAVLKERDVYKRQA